MAGKPLIAYSILAAQKASFIDRVVVSTEDEEIAAVAKSWGAEVPFLRPKELATDRSVLGKVMSHTISQLGGLTEKRAFVQLYPTSPFRTPAFIDEMLNILYSGYSSVKTVKKVHFDPQHLYIMDPNTKELCDIMGENSLVCKQKTYYRPYSVLIANLLQKVERHYFYEITDKCMLIDIDTQKDLKLAETVIEKDLFDFGF
ncbi:NeuA1: predicted N-acetylneuraminate cytidylyltransferase [Desulfosarcina variabilis str. Montpellier]